MLSKTVQSHVKNHILKPFQDLLIKASNLSVIPISTKLMLSGFIKVLNVYDQHHFGVHTSLPLQLTRQDISGMQLQWL